MSPARTAAAAPTSSDPLLVVNRFWAISTTSSSFLLREYGYTWVEASDGARFRSRCVGAGCEMHDEIAGKVSGGHVRNRTGARIIVAAPVSAPASNVKDTEADDRENHVPRTSERSKRDHEDVDDPSVVRREWGVRIVGPVVVTRLTGTGTLIRTTEDPILNTLSELAHGGAGLNRHAWIAVWKRHRKQRRLVGPGARKVRVGVDRVFRFAAGSDLVPEVACLVAVERAVSAAADDA